MTSNTVLRPDDSGIILSPELSSSDQLANGTTHGGEIDDENPHLFKPLLTSSPSENGHIMNESRVDFEKIRSWNSNKVKMFLTSQGFGSIAKTLHDHHVDGHVLVSMSEKDLLLPLLDLKVFGDIRRLSSLLEEIRDAIGLNLMSSSRPSTNKREQAQTPDKLSTLKLDYKDFLSKEKRLATRLSSVGSDFGDSANEQSRKPLKVDFKKMVVSMVYVQVALWLTSYTMVIVHDRVPDVEKYPPLPDLVLDNVPYIAWAFQAVETIGIAMMSCLFIILFFHKHRTIIWRRCCALTGTVFLLRCVTMLITSLSVPGAHLKCDPDSYPEIWMRLHRAFVIWSGFGMTLQGVRTCGDYMFSGHTTVITLLNMFITEYTPARWYPLHTATWVANLFGVFFILAAHEHYSIDVFIAFYISSRLFLYYHSLANTKRFQRDRRTKIWFPLFSYFEENAECEIPNEYEWPLTRLKTWMKNKDTISDLLDKDKKYE